MRPPESGKDTTREGAKASVNCKGIVKRGAAAARASKARVSKMPHESCREPLEKSFRSEFCRILSLDPLRVAHGSPGSSRIGDDPGLEISLVRRPASGRTAPSRRLCDPQGVGTHFCLIPRVEATLGYHVRPARGRAAGAKVKNDYLGYAWRPRAILEEIITVIEVIITTRAPFWLWPKNGTRNHC
jgi:hypothetical protein